MGAFGGLIITNKGLALQAKAQIGAELNFTRIGVGDGTLGGQPIPNLTSLINEKMSLTITKLKVLSAGKAVVGGVLSNQDVTTGFYFREIGVFAMDPDEGEILYCYGNAGSGAEYIPPGGGPDVIEKQIDLVMIIGNASNVSAEIPSEVYATVDQLDAHISATTGVHGATSEATADSIVQRDAAGRAKFAAPLASDDAARKQEVDAVQTNLTNHISATTGVHGATSAATANTIIQRDSAGRAKVAAPAAADDISTKGYVDNAVANRARTDTRPIFTAGIQDGDANNDVSIIKSVQHHAHTRTVELTYSGGNLSTVTEKDGANTIKTTTLNYSGGRLGSVVEVAGGVTVTQTLNYDGNGNLTSVTRAVS